MAGRVFFADLNSVKMDRNRISLGGPICTGPRMSKNTLPSIDYHHFRNKKFYDENSFPDIYSQYP
jgi:hypothetical protein